MTPKYLKRHIFVSVQDRSMVIIDHQQKSAHAESDGHVVTPKDQNRDPNIFGAAYLCNGAR